MTERFLVAKTNVAVEGLNQNQNKFYFDYFYEVCQNLNIVV
jgi:hypothetical protein